MSATLQWAHSCQWRHAGALVHRWKSPQSAVQGQSCGFKRIFWGIIVVVLEQDFQVVSSCDRLELLQTSSTPTSRLVPGHLFYFVLLPLLMHWFKSQARNFGITPEFKCRILEIVFIMILLRCNQASGWSLCWCFSRRRRDKNSFVRKVFENIRSSVLCRTGH